MTRTDTVRVHPAPSLLAALALAAVCCIGVEGASPTCQAELTKIYGPQPPLKPANKQRENACLQKCFVKYEAVREAGPYHTFGLVSLQDLRPSTNLPHFQ